jgi:phosphatidylglycerophosphatase A
MTSYSYSVAVKPNFKWVFQTASRTIAFGFGSGLSPIAPGTVGTLWAWAAFLIGEYFFSTADFLWLIGGGILFGCWVCGHVSEELGKKDFGGIVWDEIVAFWLVLIVIMPTSIWMQIIAFALFRYFDAAKPGPIGVIDRHFKNADINNEQPSTFLKVIWRGFGIVIDDLAAAFCTLLAIALIQFLI